MDTCVMHLEELRRCMPNLSAGTLSIILPIRRVTLGDFVVEVNHVLNLIEGYGRVCRRKDSRLFGKVTVIGVVQRVLYVVAHEHLDLGRRFGVRL